MVKNLALQYVQNNEDAEEIVQDVFVSVYFALENFKSNAKISTWIYRITINKSLDFIKAQKRKKRFAFILPIIGNKDINTMHTINHPGIELEQKEALSAIFSALNQLKDTQKTALILSKIEQLPNAEIAEILGISLKALESLLSRAKNNLLKNLNKKKDL
jgi:RNA polymerase sigma factor (sigma-70 family)